MTDPFAALDTTLFAVFGESATYTPVSGAPFSVQVVVHYDVQRVGETGFIEQRTELDLLVAEVPAPARKDTIAVGAETFKVDQVLSRDRYVVKVAVL